VKGIFDPAILTELHEQRQLQRAPTPHRAYSVSHGLRLGLIVVFSSGSRVGKTPLVMWSCMKGIEKYVVLLGVSKIAP
jgi:hypothetical protein